MQTYPNLALGCPRLLNKREIADRYNVSVSCINKWMKQGMPRIKLRYKTVRFNPIVCDAYFLKLQEPPESSSKVRRRRKIKVSLKPESPLVQLDLPFPEPEPEQLWLNFG